MTSSRSKGVFCSHRTSILRHGHTLHPKHPVCSSSGPQLSVPLFVVSRALYHHTCRVPIIITHDCVFTRSTHMTDTELPCSSDLYLCCQCPPPTLLTFTLCSINRSFLSALPRRTSYRFSFQSNSEFRAKMKRVAAALDPAVDASTPVTAEVPPVSHSRCRCASVFEATFFIIFMCF